MKEQEYKFTAVNDEDGRIWDMYATHLESWDEMTLRFSVIETCHSIPTISIYNMGEGYVVDFSRLRSEKDFVIKNFVPIAHISDIEALIEAMKKCLSIALSNFSTACPGYEKHLISFSKETNIRSFIADDKYMQALLNQLVFDALFEYYLKNAPKITKYKAANTIARLISKSGKSISFYEKMIKTEYRDIVSYTDTIRNTINSGFKAETTRISDSTIKTNIELMGLSPDEHLNQFSKSKKSLLSWIFLYINQTKKLISSLQYRKQLKSKGNNITKENFISDLFMYHLFRDLFNPSQASLQKLLENTMIYYSIESYKKIDFMLYLLDKCESHQSILHDIDKLESSFDVIHTEPRNSLDDGIEEEIIEYRKASENISIFLQTSTPAAFLQRHMRPVLKLYALDNNGYIAKRAMSSHCSQLKMPVLLEKELLDYALSPDNAERTDSKSKGDEESFNYYGYFQLVDAYTILRNKAFEIFSADFVFDLGQMDKTTAEARYAEINRFIRHNYDVLGFHKEIKSWDTINKLEDKILARQEIESEEPSPQKKTTKKATSKNDEINLLKKRMMILNSYLFPNIES